MAQKTLVLMDLTLRKIALGCLLLLALIGLSYFGGWFGAEARQASATELNSTEDLSLQPESQLDRLQAAPRISAGDLDSFAEGPLITRAKSKERAPERSALATPGQESSFVIRVLDSEGQVVTGMSVELHPQGGDSDLDLGISNGGGSQLGETDGRGQIVIEDLEETLARQEVGQPAQGGLDPAAAGRWALRARFLAREPVQLLLTEAHLLAGQAELRLPPSGSVRVEVLGADGKPARDVYEVRLRRKTQEQDLDPTQAFDQVYDTCKTDASGSALFSAVGLGVECIASALRTDGTGESRSESGLISSAGELLTLRVDMASGHPVLSFRAVNEQSEVLKNTRLELLSTSLFGKTIELDTKTDPGGLFYLEFDRFGYFGSFYTVTSATEPERTGSIQVKDRFENGVHHLGDVLLRESGPLASGMVVDGAGRPVTGAQVFVGLEEATGSAHSDQVTSVSDDEGSFALVGPRPSEKLKLWAVHGGQRSEQSMVELGATGLRIELQLQCNVTGTLFVPEGEFSAPRLKLVPQEGRSTGGTVHRGSGAFEMQKVLPGSYRFECWLGFALAYQCEVEVQGDTLLGIVDLREHLFPHRLTLLGRRDLALDGVLRWRSSAEEQADWSVSYLGQEPLIFWSASREVDFELFVTGHRKASGRSVGREVEISLEPPLLVRLVLDTDGPLPKLPYLFRPTLHTEGQAVGGDLGSAYFTEQNREILLELPNSGTYSVTWSLERRSDNMSVGAPVLEDHILKVDVLELGGEQVIRLKLDAQVLEDLVRSPPF